MENGNGSDAELPASGINRTCPVTVLTCGFETISVSLLPSATKVTTVAPDALRAHASASSSAMAAWRCTK
jgi:hypothetical protein